MLTYWNFFKNLKLSTPPKTNFPYLFHNYLLSICYVPNIHDTKIISWKTSVYGNEQGPEIQALRNNKLVLNATLFHYHSRDFCSSNYYPSTKTQFRHKTSMVLPSLHRLGLPLPFEHTAFIELIIQLYLVSSLTQASLDNGWHQKHRKFLVYNSPSKYLFNQ